MTNNKHATAEQNEISQWNMSWRDWLVFMLPFLLPVSIALGLGLESIDGSGGQPHGDFRDVAHWFDPVFFQYTLVLWLVAVLVIPTLALSYLQMMTIKKERRLLREIPVIYHDKVQKRMARRTSFYTFWGSVTWATVVVILGTSIILLFKPVLSDEIPGVNFELGANFLMMGPYIELFGKNPEDFYSHLIRSLTAFQFGFLGAYVYFIGTLTRAYFTLDLTSHTFVDGTIRMIVASILALVLSFSIFGSLDSEHAVPGTSAASPTAASISKHSLENLYSSPAAAIKAPPDTTTLSKSGEADLLSAKLLSFLPMISFFFGFYPSSALMAIERITLKVIKKLPGNSYRSLPLSMLSGMSYTHELRLNREGFDNIENLSKAEAVDLAVRTHFSYGQLKQWIGEAWLAMHLREDYPQFVKFTGILSREDLQHFLSRYDTASDEAINLLTLGLVTESVAAQHWKARLTVLRILLETESI
ncbi:MAG: hypothetical protein Q8K59_05310 [Nitrosomonas sp.]|nr:hypothetical protein [Nitrosomonas sp.]MDP1950502.1 hypothetical protein [Nitrosomonas sp.]